MTTLSAVIGLGLLMVDDKSSLQLKLSTVGGGILSAALFGAFVTLFINRESKHVMESSLQSLFEQQQKDVLDLVSTTSKVHLPAKEYPPTGSFDEVFTTDLINDMRVSSSFQFRGSSAKWVAPYVNYCRKSFAEIQVLMLNPVNTAALRQRAADRLLIPSNTGRTLDAVVEELRNEVTRTIVALFDLRHTSKVCVSLDGTLVSVVRLERTDDAIYVALYHARPGSSAVNPTTYRYVRGAIAFETYSLEVARQLEIAQQRVTFERGQDDADLVKIFKGLGLDEIGGTEIAALRMQAKNFEKRFFANMTRIER
ncbi:hypothetical protein [Micromonospora sp. NPDC005174]|uniref:hypothetical protein n=1 Tax=Micromonospora sp. NPDC005174 TaxID=3157018 RepID=UPI00339FE971